MISDRDNRTRVATIFQRYQNLCIARKSYITHSQTLTVDTCLILLT